VNLLWRDTDGVSEKDNPEDLGDGRGDGLGEIVGVVSYSRGGESGGLSNWNLPCKASSLARVKNKHNQNSSFLY
jgi:hypothetical protein